MTTKKFTFDIDINSLIGCLCCPPKFQYIYRTMAQCNKEELLTLRNILRSYTENNFLHSALENEFNIRLQEK